MFYGFTEEDQVYVDLAKQYAEKRLAPLANDPEPSEEKARAINRELADMGFVGMCLPKQYGGLGASRVQYCGVIEALCTVNDDFNTGITKVNMDGNAFVKFASPELREKYLPRLIAGEIVPATALTEPGVGSDASGNGCQCVTVVGVGRMLGEERNLFGLLTAIEFKRAADHIAQNCSVHYFFPLFL